MAKERPSLTSLSDRLARKAAPPPSPEAAPAPVASTVSTLKADARVQVMVRMSSAERKALRQIALEQDTTAQALIEEAIRDVLRRHARL